MDKTNCTFEDEASQSQTAHLNENATLRQIERSQPYRQDGRRAEHASAALRLLEHLRQKVRDGVDPSTAELQDERIYGLRPVNRIGDLTKGKYNCTRYDVERLDCGHGVYRWRLHEPARPGYPKDKRQNVLPLSQPAEPSTTSHDNPPAVGDWYVARCGKPRPNTPADDAESLPLFAAPGVR